MADKAPPVPRLPTEVQLFQFELLRVGVLLPKLGFSDTAAASAHTLPTPCTEFVASVVVRLAEITAIKHDIVNTRKVQEFHSKGNYR